MQCTIFLILPTWAVFFAFSLPPSVDPTYINIITSKQDALKQPEATVFRSAVSYFKSSVETNFPIFAIAFLN